MARKILDFIQDVDNVVWDWNGTLLNDLAVVLQAEAEHFPVYGMTPPTPEKRNEIFCFPIKTYYERVGFDFSKLDFDEVNRQFMDVYEKTMEAAPLFEGMLELLQEINDLGKKQFILSAASQSHLESILNQRAIAHFFKGIYGLPHTNADSKLNRGRQMVADHKLDPRKTLMIGDTEHDYEVGDALDFEVLLLADGHKPYEKLAAVHHQVLRTRYEN